MESARSAIEFIVSSCAAAAALKRCASGIPLHECPPAGAARVPPPYFVAGDTQITTPQSRGLLATGKNFARNASYFDTPQLAAIGTLLANQRPVIAAGDMTGFGARRHRFICGEAAHLLAARRMRHGGCGERRLLAHQ
jgi:hypothetical protein